MPYFIPSQESFDLKIYDSLDLIRINYALCIDFSWIYRAAVGFAGNSDGLKHRICFDSFFRSYNFNVVYLYRFTIE